MEKKRLFLYILLIFIAMVLSLFFIRLFSEKQLDDVSPGIPCSKELLNKADTLFVIPDFNNNDIGENKTWCTEILALNKKLAMHGVHHTYDEFSEEKDLAYIEEGKLMFKKCFGFYPQKFKPPQMDILEKNEELIKKADMKINSKINQILHKTYHCNDSGVLPNKIINFF